MLAVAESGGAMIIAARKEDNYGFPIQSSCMRFAFTARTLDEIYGGTFEGSCMISTGTLIPVLRRSAVRISKKSCPVFSPVPAWMSVSETTQ